MNRVTTVNGRKPQISTARREVVALKRQVRAVLSNLARLDSRLAMLDAYYGKSVVATRPKLKVSRQPKPGRKPNVRDLAAEILKRSGKPMALVILAERVSKPRGKKSGKAFAMNLGTALRKDRRFRRVGRGVYGLRRSGGREAESADGKEGALDRGLARRHLVTS